jgi:photosystem II stability/assembly factor-like uncharacterized protein
LADGSKLVAISSGQPIYTSTDSGVTWTQRDIARLWLAVASSADGSKLVAVGNSSIYTSTDSGVTWTPQASAGTRTWGGLASSADATCSWRT